MEKLLLNNLKNSLCIRRFKRRETIPVANLFRRKDEGLIHKKIPKKL